VVDVDIKVLGELRKRLSNLPNSLQKIVLKDLETAAANRISVMERTQIEK
jgi:hypothetical protein